MVASEDILYSVQLRRRSNRHSRVASLNFAELQKDYSKKTQLSADRGASVASVNREGEPGGVAFLLYSVHQIFAYY